DRRGQVVHREGAEPALGVGDLGGDGPEDERSHVAPVGPPLDPPTGVDPGRVAPVAQRSGRGVGDESAGHGRDANGWANRLGSVIVVWVVVALVDVIGLAAVGAYNRFVRQRTLIDNSWSNVDTEQQRRYDLIPNL